MTQELKTQVRLAAYTAMAFYPNSHLGTYSRRYDLRAAFKAMRRCLESGMDAWQAATYVYCDAQRYADM